MSNKQYECDDQMVSHPKHYQSASGLEVIDVIKAFTADLQGIEAVDTANVIKYICRWKSKNGIQDLEKAKWYLTDLINELKSKQEPKKRDERIEMPTFSDNPRFFKFEDAERALDELCTRCLANGSVSVAELRQIAGRVSTTYDEHIGWTKIDKNINTVIEVKDDLDTKSWYQIYLPEPKPLVVKFNELKESK